MAEDIIQEAEQAIEEIVEFPFKPGGIIDRHRQERARREALQKEREQAAEQVEEESYKSVKVIILAPEIISGNTFTLAPGQNVMILPAMPYRYAATIMLVPLTGQTPVIVLAKDSGQALSSVGFTLSAGVAMRIITRAQLWAFNPSGTLTVQVSALAEIYGPEA